MELNGDLWSIICIGMIDLAKHLAMPPTKTKNQNRGKLFLDAKKIHPASAS